MELRERIVSRLDGTRYNNIRNVDIFCMYYGIDTNQYHTQASIGIRFDLSRERVRQIISKLTRLILREQIPEIQKIIEIIEQHDLVDGIKLHSEIQKVSVFTGRIDKLLELIKAYSTNFNYVINDENFSIVKKGDNEKIYISRVEISEMLKEAVERLKKSTGQIGVLALDDFLKTDANSRYNSIKGHLYFIISKHDGFKTFTHENKLYFCYENFNNTLENALRKMSNYTKIIDLNLLSEIMNRYLNKRTKEYPIPKTFIISRYLEVSKYITVENNIAEIILDPIGVTPIEKDIIEIIDRVEDYINYEDLYEKLINFGHMSDLIIKEAYHSLFLYADERLGRGEYRFYPIVKRGSTKNLEELLRYNQIKAKLDEIEETDILSEQSTRREQYLLRRWLFGNYTVNHCAICSREFSVNALVAAHKKYRSLCTETERRDPNIVFPLCSHGCDYLYEKRIVIIKDGKVSCDYSKVKTIDERQILTSLEGREIEKRYVQGEYNYFI